MTCPIDIQRTKPAIGVSKNGFVGVDLSLFSVVHETS
jgi:hypothetical protein